MEPDRGSIRYLLAGAFHSMAYVAWGPPGAPTVVCIHGLTRQGRDFDALAMALSDRFRVICPDLPGRGASDWLPDAVHYQPASYVPILAHLLAGLKGPVDWIGTSLGGICGMAIAAMPGQPIRRLVLNDIGPFIPAAALARIRDYMGDPRETKFADLAALERHLRAVHAPFGNLGDDGWAHLARHSARALPGGGYALHYDPAIAEPVLENEPTDISLAPIWGRIKIPVLAIRGANSDLLLPETLDLMAASGARTHIVADTGHAPALMDAPTIGVIRDFLTATA